jgi:hypothetical protein
MEQCHIDLPEGQETPLPAPQLDPKAVLSGGEDLEHAYKRMDAEKKCAHPGASVVRHSSSAGLLRLELCFICIESERQLA